MKLSYSFKNAKVIDNSSASNEAYDFKLVTVQCCVQLRRILSIGQTKTNRQKMSANWIAYAWSKRCESILIGGFYVGISPSSSNLS